jgi:hypothetical protein
MGCSFFVSKKHERSRGTENARRCRNSFEVFQGVRMSSIPGPIIVFRVGGDDLSGALRPQFDKIKNDAKAASNQIAADWQRMSAQIRAGIATEAISTKEVVAARKDLVATLDKEIAGLRTRNDLTTKELATLKAQTMERERQVDAIKRGSSVGITAGTSSALSSVSFQTTMGIERVLDSLVNRYFGGAAGAAFRTARDVQYYSAQASGAARSSLFSGANLAVLGGVGAVGISAAAITAAAVAGGKLAVELDNTAKKMGLTTDAAIRLRSAAEAVEVPFDSLAPTFRKFSTELTLATTASLPNASKEAQKAGELFKILGINVKQAAADPLVGLQQLSKSLNALPDGAIKSAVANQLFGKSYESILPVLAKLPTALDATKKSSEDLARALGIDVLNSADALRAGLINWKNESDAFEIALAQNVLPTLVKFVGLINDVVAATRSALTPVAREQSEIGGFLRSRNQQLTPLGTSQLGLFLTAQNQASRSLNPFDLSTKLDDYTGNPQRAISDFLSSKEGQGAGILEPFKQSINGVGETSKATAKEMKALAGVIGNVGDGSARAAKLAKEYEELIYKAVTRPGRPERSGSGGGRGGESKEHDEIIKELEQKYQIEAGQRLGVLLPGVTGAPNIGGGSPTFSGASVLGTTGTNVLPPDVLEKIKSVNDEWYNQTASASQKIQDEYRKNYEYFKTIQDLFPEHASEINATLVKLEQEKNKQIEDLDDDSSKKQLEKFKEESGKLFDDLLSGKGKSFGKAFEKDILDIATAPIKKMFEDSFSGLFVNVANLTKAPFGGAPAAGGFNFGGIFSGLGGLFGLGKVGPGGTAGFFPGPIGSGAGGRVGGGVAGQFGVASMTVTAGVVNLTGQLGLPGTGPLGGGGATGNFFGNLNPFSDNNLPFDQQSIARAAAAAGINGGAAASSSPSNASSILSTLGPFLASGALLGMGLGSKNANAAIMGAAGLTGSALTTISKSLSSANGISNLTDTLNIAGKALPGIGMYAAGIQQGGVSGTLESTAGGAMAGLAIGGPIGAAIGAGVGLISGVLSSVISGPSFAQRVQKDMLNQQYHAPPSETFSFAMGNTIADTLSTGFNQSGSHFGTYGLAAGTPFSASAITGRLTRDQQIDLAMEQMGLLSNQPFLGFPTTDPFVGQGLFKNKTAQNYPQVNNYTIHAMDSQSFSEFLGRNGNDHTVARVANSLGALSSSRSGSSTRGLVNLP